MKATLLLNKEFPMDAKSDGIIVMPVNLQGLLEFGKDNRRFKHEFPKVYKEYLKDCILGNAYAGETKIYTEGKFTVALLYYKNFEIGKHVEHAEKQDLQMTQCLIKLLNMYPDNMKFYSPVIPFKAAQMRIVSKDCNSEWIVLREVD